MNKEIFNPSVNDYFEKCTAFIQKSFLEYSLKPNDRTRMELLCEEALVRLTDNMTDGALMEISVRSSFGKVIVEMKARGEELTTLSSGGTIALAAESAENEDAIRDLIFKAYSDNFRYVYKSGVNRVRILSGSGDRNNQLIWTLGALILSILAGFLCRIFLPQEVNAALCKYAFTPIKTMFINALKIVVGPVVFFSIVTCISDFKDLSELGKIGAKVMLMYLLTTFIAIVIGIGMFSLINPGEWGMALKGGMESVEVSVNSDAEVSILNTIVNIVPSNLLKPFVESDTLQIIFLAILIGVAVGMIGEYSAVLKDIFTACNELFTTVTSLIAKLIPVAVFSAMFIMIVSTGTDSLMAMLGMAGTDVVSLLCMMLCYGILILIFARINPLHFYRKDWPGMLTSFSLSSSNAAMPGNIAICKDKLGIFPKVCDFSIPLGATVNMDGTSIHLAVASLFLAKVYGVAIPQAAMVSIVITIIMLSLGTPGVPGASLVCLSVLLTQIGVPIEAIGLIMGVDSLLDMCRTTSNTTGDMAVTLIVAKSESLLDMDVYRS
ncbi:MAG: dicarboxylate/amino acid:cation symporter [Lachnospiraceae bacterium]|nr:dicarboxylate/amino acid:cation symporter [Lachnospiraceae bacterium]